MFVSYSTQMLKISEENATKLFENFKIKIATTD